MDSFGPKAYLLLGLLAAPTVGVGQPSWHVQFLPLPAGTSDPSVRSLDNSGAVAGVLFDGVTTRPVVWPAGGGAPQFLTSGPQSAGFFWCHHLSEEGIVVGTMRIGQDDAAFRWAPGIGLVPIMTVPGQGHSSEAHAINAGGAVAGAIDLKAVYWTAAGGPMVIEFPGAPAAVNYGGALGINDAGVVVGFAGHPAGGNFPQEGIQAFRWTAGGGIEPLVWLGGCISWAADINADGHIVGTSATACPSTPEDPEKAWLWRNGVVTVLGDLSSPDSDQALAINDAGEVLGFDGLWGGVGPWSHRHWVWRDGTKAYLDDAPIPVADSRSARPQQRRLGLGAAHQLGDV